MIGAREGRLKRLWRDTRGASELVPTLLTQVPWWFLVTLIVVVALVGLKQAGMASLAHLATRRAGSSSLDAGVALVQDHGTVWRLPAEATTFAADSSRRAVTLTWDFAWQSQTLAGRVLGRALRLRSLTLSRQEGFYAGPPDDWE